MANARERETRLEVGHAHRGFGVAIRRCGETSDKGTREGLDPAARAAIALVGARRTKHERQSSMTSRRRFFGTSDREAFYAALRVMRDACIAVCRAAPIKGLDYRTASDLKERIDDAVEALTGNRQALWLQPHGNVVREQRETPVFPVEPDKEEDD
jgi:hypothetical protein